MAAAVQGIILDALAVCMANQQIAPVVLIAPRKNLTNLESTHRTI
jgi:hypothetical protein